MTEETPQTAEKDQPTGGNQDAAAPQAQASPGGSSGLAIFAVLLSVIAIGSAAFTWYQVRFTQQQNASDVIIGLTEISGRIEQFGRELDRITTEQQGFMSREALELALERNVRDLQDRQEDLEASVGRIRAEFERGVDSWVLEEVEQMLGIASQGLVLTGNPDSALTALRIADSGLEGIADPRYTPVRIAIASDIEALEGIALPDLNGTAAELIALSEAVSGMPLINEPEGTPLEGPVLEVAGEETPAWQQELGEFANDLIGLVRIQKVDEPPRPLLEPEQRYFLEQNLKLLLQASQLALLQREHEVYRQNLRQAAEWTRAWFDMADPGVSAFVADIDRLAGLDVEVSLPDISGSLLAFRRVNAREEAE